MNSLNSALFDASIWRSCLNGTTGMEGKLRGEDLETYEDKTPDTDTS